jgi:thiol-disulfide isomerase/thioredoxin
MKPIILLFLTNFIVSYLYGQVGYATLSGNLAFAENGQMVRLLVNRYGIGSFPTSEKAYTAIVKDHVFQFHIPIGNVPLYFSLDCPSWGIARSVSGHYFLENGDRVMIDELTRTGLVHFSGKGALKLNLAYQLLESVRESTRACPEPRVASDVKNYFLSRDTLVSNALKDLEEERGMLSANAYQLIKTGILAQSIAKVNVVGGRFSPIKQPAQIDSALVALKAYHDGLAEKYRSQDRTYARLLPYADTYAGSVIIRYIYDSCTVQHQPFQFKKCYLFLKEYYQSNLRDRMILTLLYHDRRKSPEIPNCIQDAETFVQDPDLRQLLDNMKQALVKGLPAYPFELPDTSGNLHRLSDYRGKVVVIDCWFTSCGNCKRLIPYLEKIEKEFKGQAVEFVTISSDKNEALWKKSIQSGAYTTPYGLNLYTAGQGMNHPFIRNNAISGAPTLMVIDGLGRVSDTPVDPRFDNGKSLTAIVKANIAGLGK